MIISIRMYMYKNNISFILMLKNNIYFIDMFNMKSLSQAPVTTPCIIKFQIFFSLILDH